MFGRWLKLLGVLFIIAVLAVYFASKLADRAEAFFREIHTECQEYLLSLPSTWEPDGDMHYTYRCDSDREFSVWSQRLEHRDRSYRAHGNAILAALLILPMILLSFLARWLITGRWKLN